MERQGMPNASNTDALRTERELGTAAAGPCLCSIEPKLSLLA